MGWQLAVGESELELPLLNHMESCQTGFVNKTHTFFSFLFGGVSLLFIFLFALRNEFLKPLKYFALLFFIWVVCVCYLLIRI